MLASVSLRAQRRRGNSLPVLKRGGSRGEVRGKGCRTRVILQAPHLSTIILIDRSSGCVMGKVEEEAVFRGCVEDDALMLFERLKIVIHYTYS